MLNWKTLEDLFLILKEDAGCIKFAFVTEVLVKQYIKHSEAAQFGAADWAQ